MDDRQCPICAAPIDTTARRPGRPRVYCTPRHRALAWYRRHRDYEAEQAAAMTTEQLLDFLLLGLVPGAEMLVPRRATLAVRVLAPVAPWGSRARAGQEMR